MSLQWMLSRTVPADTYALGQILFPATNLYRQIGDRFDDLFPLEVIFTLLYEATGRGAIPPLLMSLVTVFQAWEKVPDRLAAECVVSRIDWKYALHLPLTYLGFHFTDLTAFRARLTSRGEERLVFDQVLSKLKDAGLVKKGGKARTDSTHILAVVEHLGRMELVTESIRVALQAVSVLVPAWVEQRIPSPFRDVYGERQAEYGLSDNQVQQKLIQAGRDGLWFLAQWDRAVPVAPDQVPSAVETLRTVLAQQFPGGDPQSPAPKRPSGRDVIESPHEPEARRGTKRSISWTGYKAQVTETCDAERPHLITDMDVTNALANDSPELPKIQERLQRQDTTPEEHHVDAGYMSGENLVTSAQKGITLMGKPLADTQGPKGFQQADFQIDETAHQARCPAGQTSTYWHEDPAPANGDAPIDIRFDGATCQQCPFYGQCTSSPRGRSLHLHPYRKALTERRLEAQMEAFLIKIRVRAGVEGTISQLVRGTGTRCARYRGQVKVRLQAFFAAVAINLKRVVSWWVAPRPQAGLTVTG